MVSFRDWVVETSSTTGTSAYALSGSAPAGTSYFTFRQRYANGEDEIVYWVVNADRTKWEKNRFGTLTYGSPDTLSRNVVESTNGDAPVSWVGGDTPLRIYVVPDADAEEFAITMGLGSARPGVLKYGLWAKQDEPSAGLQTIYLQDGGGDPGDIPFAIVDPAAHTFRHLNIAVQTFDSSGTYTPNAKMVYCIIEAIGGGGGGGGIGGLSNASVGAGGGGAGGYSRKIATAADIGASQSVTIGAGGTGVSNAAGNNGSDTSVGSLCIAKGGSGGAASGSPTGGAGGVAGTGDFTPTGMPGSNGVQQGGTTTFGGLGGNGGSSYFGGGGRGAYAGSSVVAGGAATAYGGGGGGAAGNNGAANAAGGNGSAGVVIITEFCRV